MENCPSYFYANRTYESSYHYSDHIHPIVNLNVTKIWKVEYLQVCESNNDGGGAVCRTRADVNSVAEPSRSIILPHFSSGSDVVSGFLSRYLSESLADYPPGVCQVVAPEALRQIPSGVWPWWQDKGFCLTISVEVVQVFDRTDVIWTPQQGRYHYDWRGGVYSGGQHDNQGHGQGGASTMMYRDEGFFRETMVPYRGWRSILRDNLKSDTMSRIIDPSLQTQVFKATAQDPSHERDGGNYFATTSCAICLEEFSDGMKVSELRPCYHIFHGSCIRTWLQRKTCCPVCRQKLLDQ